MGIKCSIFSKLQKNNTNSFSYLYCKSKSGKSSGILREINFKYDLNLRKSDLTLRTVVLIWCKEFSALCKKESLDKSAKECLMRDFLDTLYLHENSFDCIFLLLCTTPKSRSLILARNRQSQYSLSCFEIRNVVTEIMNYALLNGLKYSNQASGLAENPIDFPLKTFGLCTCSSRPIYMAAVMTKPHLICRLLNFGACIPNEEACATCLRGRYSHPIDIVLRFFKIILSRKKVDCEFAMRHRRDIITCCNILLVDVPYYSEVWKKMVKVLRQFMTNHMNGDIPSLKHICRFHIRHILKMRNAICKPNLWESFVLPPTLVSYMSIDYIAEELPFTII